MPHKRLVKSLPVSIHAPARGATIREAPTAAVLRVSIHAPARGATRTVRKMPGLSRVSIHAPARGATGHDQYGRDRRAVSIHAPARGATRMLGQNHRLLLFQSTRPRGARPKSACWMSVPVSFQSTRPRGARPNYYLQRLIIIHVSIHAPARGATRIDCAVGQRARVSIHAPARGATDAGFRPGVRLMFQSTRPRGARPPLPDASRLP